MALVLSGTVIYRVCTVRENQGLFLSGTERSGSVWEGGS